jgi:5-methyltetrahydropteroyltriglutamate--homocysteine methyltransferase
MTQTLQTTVVGSYPIPDWLKLQPTAETLADAIVVAMRAQEAAGIDVISDGELGRWDLARNAAGGMVERFIRPMTGVQCDLTRAQLESFQARADMNYRQSPAGIVTGALGDGMLDLKRDWLLARRLTHCPLKFTVTSPYMIARVLDNTYYHSFEELAMALADILARQLEGIQPYILQIDEPNLPGSPGDGPLAAQAINRVLDAVAAPVKAVHLCFGNYGGQRIQRGEYTHLIHFMNALHCDHLVLETTRRSTDELTALREVKETLRFALGVIDVKDLQIESPDVVARRIERLAQIVGGDRLAYVNPDCGLRVLPRPVADGKLRALVAGRDLYTGYQV